jgi:hypothetical protein
MFVFIHANNGYSVPVFPLVPTYDSAQSVSKNFYNFQIVFLFWGMG